MSDDNDNLDKVRDEYEDDSINWGDSQDDFFDGDDALDEHEEKEDVDL